MHRESVHRFCQIDWLHWYDLEVNHNDPVFLPTAQRVLPELCLIAPYVFPPAAVQPHPFLIQEHNESSCKLGSFGMTKSHLRVLTMFWCATAIIILIH